MECFLTLQKTQQTVALGNKPPKLLQRCEGVIWRFLFGLAGGRDRTVLWTEFVTSAEVLIKNVETEADWFMLGK